MKIKLIPTGLLVAMLFTTPLTSCSSEEMDSEIMSNPASNEFTLDNGSNNPNTELIGSVKIKFTNLKDSTNTYYQLKEK